MNAKRLLRKIHYWSTLVVALTAGTLAATGVLLALRKDIEWLQPEVRVASAAGPSDASVRDLFEAARSQDSTLEWERLNRIDVRLQDGIAKVVTDDYREFQVDIHDLTVLNEGYRGGDLVEKIHDTTFLHAGAKYWLLIPAGVALFIMWLTGIYMFIVTQAARLKKQKRLRPHA